MRTPCFSRLLRLPSSRPRTRDNCGLGYEFKHQSLMTPSAKVWLAEHTKEVDLDCPGCKGEWSSGTVKNLEQPEILNGVWEQLREA